jgi:hypothetical protein
MVWLGFTSDGGYETATPLLSGNVMILLSRCIRTADSPSQWRPRNKEIRNLFYRSHFDWEISLGVSSFWGQKLATGPPALVGLYVRHLTRKLLAKFILLIAL